MDSQIEAPSIDGVLQHLRAERERLERGIGLRDATQKDAQKQQGQLQGDIDALETAAGDMRHAREDSRVASRVARDAQVYAEKRLIGQIDRATKQRVIARLNEIDAEIAAKDAEARQISAAIVRLSDRLAELEHICARRAAVLVRALDELRQLPIDLRQSVECVQRLVLDLRAATEAGYANKAYVLHFDLQAELARLEQRQSDVRERELSNSVALARRDLAVQHTALAASRADLAEQQAALERANKALQKAKDARAGQLQQLYAELPDTPLQARSVGGA